MTDLLTQLNWRIAPPEPPQRNKGRGGNWDKWAREIYNELESQVWQIEEKHWKSSIHIGRDLVDRLQHIPESFIRDIMRDIMDGEYPALARLISRGS